MVTGGAVSGLLGSTGQFRLAYAAPAALALLLLAAARHFTQPSSPARHADCGADRGDGTATLTRPPANPSGGGL